MSRDIPGGKWVGQVWRSDPNVRAHQRSGRPIRAYYRGPPRRKNGKPVEFNVRLKENHPSDAMRERVKKAMVIYWDTMPDTLPENGYYVFDESKKDASHPNGTYVEHLGPEIESKFQVLYSGPDGHEASRVIYATGGIPYSLISDIDQRSWEYHKGWAVVNDLGKYLVLLPKDAPNRL